LGPALDDGVTPRLPDFGFRTGRQTLFRGCRNGAGIARLLPDSLKNCSD
jgi:hypothetical protein